MGSPQGCGRHPKSAAGQTGANNFSPTVGLSMETYLIFLENFFPSGSINSPETSGFFLVEGNLASGQL